MIAWVHVDGKPVSIDLGPALDANNGISYRADYAGMKLAEVTILRGRIIGTYYALKRVVFSSDKATNAATRNEQVLQADERYAQARQDKETLDGIYETLQRVICPRLRMLEERELRLNQSMAGHR